MSYTIVNTEEVNNLMGDGGGEMRMMKNALETEQVAITYRVYPPKSGAKGSHGHRHAELEEVYFVVSGNFEAKLDEDIIKLAKHDAVRVSPETIRGFWNPGTQNAEMVIVSARLSYDDSEKVDDFWPEEE